MAQPSQSCAAGLDRTKLLEGIDEPVRPSGLRWNLNLDPTDLSCCTKTVDSPFGALG